MARTILVRLNLDIKEKPIGAALRFNAAADELKKISKPNNKVVVLSHRGRPQGVEKELSLRPFAPLLSKALRKKVVFLDNADLNKAQRAIEAAPNGGVFLLENLRFLKGETENDPKLGKALASLGTNFISDDFATSHRADASLSAITGFLPSQPGDLLRGEVKNLSLAMGNPKRPFVLVVGGAKAKDKVGVVANLLRKVDLVLVGGAAANTFLKAEGFDIKKSLYEPEMVEIASKLLRSGKIEIPEDFVWDGDRILDIGPKTAKIYAVYLRGARLIVWNGPMGMFEKKKFAAGTAAVAKSVLRNNRAKSVIGGGETVAALGLKKQVQKPKANIFVSTGGGAMLEFLAGERMAGLEAVFKNKKRKK
jgi:phosphoglycerate kinase